MKYGLARLVYGLFGILLIVGGVSLFFFDPQSDNPTSAQKKTTPNALANVAIAGVPVVLGVVCLFRCRHWSREAKGKE